MRKVSRRKKALKLALTQSSSAGAGDLQMEKVMSVASANGVTTPRSFSSNTSENIDYIIGDVKNSQHFGTILTMDKDTGIAIIN